MNVLRPLNSLARNVRADRRGATAIEYGLVAALVALGMLGGLRALGGGNAGMWESNKTKVIEASR